MLISEPNSITVNIAINNPSSCNVSDASINLLVNGGTSPYSYLWNNLSTSQSIDSLSVGNYKFLVSDSNGCTYNDSVNIENPSGNLSLSLTKSDYNGYSVSCFQSNDGYIKVNPTGGNPPLSFSNNNIISSDSITGLSSGSYVIKVVDSLNCTIADTIILNQPSAINSFVTKNDVLCHGDSTGGVNIIFNGGLDPSISNNYYYIASWDTLNYQLPANIFSSMALGVGIPSGTYPYSIKDINDCFYYDTVKINQNDPINRTISLKDFNGYNVSCKGLSDAEVNIQISGGQSPYSYFINNSNVNLNSLPLNNYNAGIYQDSIIDVNGCLFTDSFIITEPDILTIDLQSNNLSCYNSCDGSVLSTPTGGVLPYKYKWNSDTTKTDSLLFAVCAGTEKITVTDYNGCNVIDSIEIFEPLSLTLNDSIIELSSFQSNDGEIYVFVSGGNQNYSYSWLGPNNFTSQNSILTNLEFGNYFLTVNDSLNCSLNDTFFVDQPTSLISRVDSIINNTCYGDCNGSIQVTADGGDSTYSYYWSGPNGYFSLQEDIYNLCSGTYNLELSDSSDTLMFTYEVLSPDKIQTIKISDTIRCFSDSASVLVSPTGGTSPFTIFWQDSSQNYTNFLPAGFHLFSLIDSNNCLLKDSIFLEEADSISLSTNINSVSCYGLSDGNITVLVDSGGYFPFTYSIDNFMTSQQNSYFGNLSADTLTISITDFYNCKKEVDVIITEPQSLNAVVNKNDASCYNFCDGTANANVSGGTSPYNFNWLGANPNNLCAGLYNVIINDVNNCQTATSFTIGQPNPIVVNISEVGGVLITDTGFTSYQWFDENDNLVGTNSNEYTPTSSGNFYVVVTDSSGCTGNSILISFEITTSLKNILNSFDIYPNPTEGELFLSISTEIESISIMNSSGLIIKKTNLVSKNMRFDLQFLPKGLYFIKLSLRDTHVVRKFILK